LKHYKDWGVNHFIFGVYQGTNNPSWQRALEIGNGYPISLIASGGKELNVEVEGDFKNEMRMTLPVNSWYIPADLDEFHAVKGYDNVCDLTDALNTEGAEYVESSFMDRITKDGSIPLTINPNISIWDQFPHDCRISDTIIRAWCNKISLTKRNILITGGHHAPCEKTKHKKFSVQGHTYHFKWFGPLYEKEKQKFELYTTQKREWAIEQTLLLNWLDSHNGKLL
jgi:hypothetical protein